MLDLNLTGLATGIGSLPHLKTSEAIKLILKFVPDIPFWPQLPRRDSREGMVSQFSEGLPCLKFNGRDLVYSPLDREKELESFYSDVISFQEGKKEDLDRFKITSEYAQGLHAFYDTLKNSDAKDIIKCIKCHITGPFTFAASVKDEKGSVLMHDKVFMQAVTEGLKMKALWQMRFFEEFGKKIIVFIDEPYLGCFGSAYTPLNREEVVSNLAGIASSIRQSGGISGIHCCGNTDWSMFVDAGVDVINFDAYSFMDRIILYADTLSVFLEKGGVLCWGIVPTQEYERDSSYNGPKLTEAIEEGINKLADKGANRDLLRKQLIISPSCGLGSLEEWKAEGIFRLLDSTSLLIREIYGS